ncbi:MAG TPA: hypothetical protein VLH75_20380 [Longimicrobiales bacterium]|nr:hypothetical protein [Longimicrobiales bacterium]
MVLTPARAAAWTLGVAVAAYANALGNGFAYDDNLILAANPVVTEGRFGDALLGPWWFGAVGGAGLWRPLTLGSFTLEWKLWGGSALGFHAVSVVGHALTALLVLLVLARLAPLAAALAGALLFAVHPVHVEAVANVVGRSEIYAALAVLSGCVVYLHPGLRADRMRGVRMGLLCVLYLAGLAGKESAVTLPAALLVLELARAAEQPLGVRLRKEVALLAGLAAVLAGYLLLRSAVLGAITGGAAAPELYGLTAAQRILTAFSLWPEYVRLLVFPVSLSADYAPAVLLVSRGVTPAVVAGLGVLGGLTVLAGVLRRRVPLATAGIAWFFVTVLPVSNLLFPAGLLLGERTLYLPSVGASCVVAGAWAVTAPRLSGPARRWGLAAAAVVLSALLVRTVARNPTWFSTWTVMNTLAQEHPESAAAMRTRALGLERVGETQAAADLWRTVLALQPNHYGFLVEGARFFGRLGQGATAAELLGRAAAIRPADPSAYRALAELRLRRGEGREAHRTALEGLARAGSDAELWALVSEAYVAKGDLAAAVRARRAALGADPASARSWDRLAELLDALGRGDEASAARGGGDALGPPAPAGSPGGPP